MAKADRQKADLWQQHVEAYRASGLTRKGYCREHRINILQLDYWRKRLNRTHKAYTSRNERGFVQLRVSDDFSSDSCIDLRIGPIIVTVKAGFDPQHLKNILQVLGAAC